MSDTPLKVEKGMTINGRLNVQGDLTISGFVEGRVSADGKVFVTREGVVRANITAEAAYIAGQVVGNITATEGVEIATGGRLEGDIVAPRVLLREGAVFLGQVAMGPVVATSGVSVPVKDAAPAQPATVDSEALPAARPAFQPAAPPEAEVVASQRIIEAQSEVIETGPDTAPPDTRPDTRRVTVRRRSQSPPEVEPTPSVSTMSTRAEEPALESSSDPLKRRVKVIRKV